MATMVLDAHALMVLFNDEPGADEVERILLKAESGSPKLLMSVVNWGEIYYSILRGASWKWRNPNLTRSPVCRLRSCLSMRVIWNSCVKPLFSRQPRDVVR